MSETIEQGESLFAAGRLDEALDCFCRVLADEPDQPRALSDAGVVLYALGRHDEAEQMLLRAAMSDGENLAVVANLGQVYLAQQRFAEAADRLEHARDLAGDDPEILLPLAESYASTGRFEESRSALEAFRDAAPDRPVPAKLTRRLAEAGHPVAVAAERDETPGVAPGLSPRERSRLAREVAAGKCSAAWRAAVVEADITPSPKQFPDIELQGYAAPGRTPRQVVTPLAMQLVLLEDANRTRVLIVSTDLFGLGGNWCDQVRQMLGPWGLPPEAIILHATHTHSAPGTVENMPAAMGRAHPQYCQALAMALHRAMEQAFASLRPCLIYAGQAEARVGVNRRLARDGNVVLQPNPDGAYDTATPLLLLDFPEADRRAVVVNHGCHPTGIGAAPVVFGDYPMVFREIVTQEADVATAVFLQGAGGDAKEGAADGSGSFCSEPNDIAANGQALAEAVRTCIEDRLVPVEGEVFARRDTASLELDGEDGPASLEMEVQTVCLGEQVCLTALPCEPVAAVGPALRSVSGGGVSFVLGYSNGLQAYLPCDEMIEEGGYEVVQAPSVYGMAGRFVPGAVERVREVCRAHQAAWRGGDRSAYGRWHETKQGEAFFCMSSGRCGTLALAKVLDTADNARVYHHPHPYLVRETLAVWHGEIDPAETFWSGRAGVVRDAWKDGLVFGEMDMNMTPLAPTLAREIPSARFLVLVRNPFGFVRSGMRRRYYLGHGWDPGRLVPEPGHPDAAAWATMPTFEKVCWLWNETYARILHMVDRISPERCRIVRFEDVIEDPGRFEEIFAFLGLTGYDPQRVAEIMATKHNEQVGGDFPRPEQWSGEMTDALWRRCGETAERFGYARDMYAGKASPVPARAIAPPVCAAEEERPAAGGDGAPVEDRPHDDASAPGVATRCGGRVPTTTIWDYKRFRHQEYPARVTPELFAAWRSDRLRLTRSTPITSMGSCFARNLAIHLMRKGCNYLLTEEPFQQASAHWDQVFNTACMRQIFEYTFTDRFRPACRWWPKGEKMQDPFRRNILYPAATCEDDFGHHVECSRGALTEARAVILTLGLIETWRDKRDAATYYRVPSPSVYDPEIHEFHLQSVEECVADLEAIHGLLAEHNPAADLVVTVSPVPLFATFRMDVDVVTANTLSKSTLRVAAEYFARAHENVHYFPSYEIVNRGVDRPFESDGRHVTQQTVARVMDVFEEQFFEA